MNRKLIFKTKIFDEKNTSYEIWCGPWINRDMFIFCEFNETFPKGNYFFQFNDKFNYLGSEINIYSYKIFNVTKLDSDLIDLYSEPQTINVTDDKDTYELKFKIISYNQERIYIIITFDEPLDCKKKNEELICQIKKQYLEGNSNKNSLENKMAPIIYINKDGKVNATILVGPITINYNVKKLDVYVKITKLLSNYVEQYNFIAYETNVTNIPSIFSVFFELKFDGEEEKLGCMFKSGVNGLLLLLCKAKKEGIVSLKEINNDNILKDINVKYNFIIKPVNINENITVINSTFKDPIVSIYPSILDFTSKDIIYIDLFVEEGFFFTGISFNEDEEDLYCVKYKLIQRCTVPKKHFKGKKNGYYYIKYFDQNLKKRFTSYFTIPISVILTNQDNSENKSNTILIISIIVSVVVVILILSIVIYICIFKKKNKDLKDDVLKTSFK